MLKYLAIFSLFCALALCQTCNFDFYQQCLSKDLKEYAEKQKFDDCLTGAGCKIPQKNQDDLNATLTPATMNSFETCMDALRKEIRSTIEKCVQTNYSDFTMMSKDGINLMKNGNFQSHIVAKRDMMDKISNRTCPNVDSMRKATSCLTAAKNNKTDMLLGRGMPPWRELCEKKNNCSTSLTPDCQKKLKGVNIVLCQCTKHELTNQRRKYWQEQWRKCSKSDNNVSASPKSSSATNGREAYGQVWMAIREFCKIDRCD